jgi:polysaccharide biosynthesis/export protein
VLLVESLEFVELPAIFLWRTRLFRSAYTVVLLTFALSLPVFAQTGAQSQNNSIPQSINPSQQQNQNQNPLCVTGQEAACQWNGGNATNNGALGQQGTQQRSSRSATYSDDRSGEDQNPFTPRRIRKPAQPTEFEQMVEDSVGKKLPLYGMSLFDEVPATFAPLSHVPVPANYVIGPGDELYIRVWGVVTLVSRTTVDRNGEIYIPQVGPVSVAGVQYSNLEERLRSEIGKIYKNFQLSATLGRLRNVQVFVVGEASFPGLYTVSSLSTLVNAVFASGGPTASGSLRRVQLKRGANVVTDFDLYDLLARGDKSKDVPIQPGDVVYFPAALGFAAVAGSVSAPAIYEIKDGETVGQAIEIAGGTTVVADDQKISVERSETNQGRSVVELTLQQARTAPVKKGDIIRVLSLVPRLDQTVILRGNVTNPGRYTWKPGMTIRDLIPSASALLTRDFWLRQSALTTGRATEYPVTQNSKNSTDLNNPDTQSNIPQFNPADAQQTGTGTQQNGVPLNGSQLNGIQLTDAQQAALSPEKRRQMQPGGKGQVAPGAADLIVDIRNSAPEINWDYALIQRVNPVDLSTQLISFDLGKAIIEKDSSVNPTLESGDIVTIFSQKDFTVPMEHRTRFIKIDGEVRAPGVYAIGPKDTLQSVVSRAGGFTHNAYLYGSQFTRESVRLQQQESLDSFISLLSAQMSQYSSAVANGNPERAGDATTRQSVQSQMIASLRELRAAGRIVLQMPPDAQGVDELPVMSLEDGDHFSIPSRPSVVNVIGAVYNQGSFLYTPKSRLKTYYNLSGQGTVMADKKRMFIIRADGGVIAGQQHSGMWKGSFDKYQMLPGDTLVVPSKLQIGAFQRNLRDWTQIFSQIALTAASLAVVSKQ